MSALSGVFKPSKIPAFPRTLVWKALVARARAELNIHPRTGVPGLLKVADDAHLKALDYLKAAFTHFAEAAIITSEVIPKHAQFSSAHPEERDSIALRANESLRILATLAMPLQFDSGEKPQDVKVEESSALPHGPQLRVNNSDRTTTLVHRKSIARMGASGSESEGTQYEDIRSSSSMSSRMSSRVSSRVSSPYTSASQAPSSAGSNRGIRTHSTITNVHYSREVRDLRLSTSHSTTPSDSEGEYLSHRVDTPASISSGRISAKSVLTISSSKTTMNQYLAPPTRSHTRRPDHASDTYRGPPTVAAASLRSTVVSDRSVSSEDDWGPYGLRLS
ncbi:hypothetical protein BV25DRAFT_1913094 [Artomyces pyxidatus]|uniref:Uncharacterized protein n=1 Tax=Artomyces pyxidatus TaxID=48021 RepID=A0ACB8TD88_9AGAM|nr:hypothetical protein BV25DRAFT_1913094 [Artomyces pyxidatus]